MPNRPTPSSSSRIENLNFTASDTRFSLDGRAVQLQGAEHAPSAADFRSLYELAAADYYARASNPRPGLLSRLRSWLSRLLGPEPPQAPAGAALPSSGSAPRAEPRTAQKSRAAAAAPEPDRASAPKADASAPAPAAKAAHPVLQAIFADDQGVHVVWQAPVRSRCTRLEFTYSLDSAMAQRLQRCYSRLSQLGYQVVGLEILSPARAPDKEREPAPRPDSAERAAPAPAPGPAQPSGSVEKAAALAPKRRPREAAPPKPAEARPDAAGSDKPLRRLRECDAEPLP